MILRWVLGKKTESYFQLSDPVIPINNKLSLKFIAFKPRSHKRKFTIDYITKFRNIPMFEQYSHLIPFKIGDLKCINYFLCMLKINVCVLQPDFEMIWNGLQMFM